MRKWRDQAHHQGMVMLQLLTSPGRFLTVTGQCPLLLVCARNGSHSLHRAARCNLSVVAVFHISLLISTLILFKAVLDIKTPARLRKPFSWWVHFFWHTHWRLQKSKKRNVYDNTCILRVGKGKTPLLSL